MEHQEIGCLHNQHMEVWIPLVFLIALWFFFTVVTILEDVKEYPYYHKWYKRLEEESGRELLVSEDKLSITSHDKGYNEIVFNLETKSIDTIDFDLNDKFPEFLDLYQLFWWFKFWHYFNKHIKPTL